ncbi:unnamed protein product [Natator depressus]
MLPAEGGTEIPGKSSYIERKSPPSSPVPRRTAQGPVCFNSSPGKYKLWTTNCCWENFLVPARMYPLESTGRKCYNFLDSLTISRDTSKATPNWQPQYSD